MIAKYDLRLHYSQGCGWLSVASEVRRRNLTTICNARVGQKGIYVYIVIKYDRDCIEYMISLVLRIYKRKRRRGKVRAACPARRVAEARGPKRHQIGSDQLRGLG